MHQGQPPSPAQTPAPHSVGQGRTVVARAPPAVTVASVAARSSSSSPPLRPRPLSPREDPGHATILRPRYPAQPDTHPPRPGLIEQPPRNKIRDSLRPRAEYPSASQAGPASQRVAQPTAPPRHPIFKAGYIHLPIGRQLSSALSRGCPLCARIFPSSVLAATRWFRHLLRKSPTGLPSPIEDTHPARSSPTGWTPGIPRRSSKMGLCRRITATRRERRRATMLTLSVSSGRSRERGFISRLCLYEPNDAP
jgi:hypothetical protein